MSDKASVVTSPKITAQEMTRNMKVYQELLGTLIEDSDKVNISGRKFLKKSGWLKLAVPFGISTTVIEESREDIGSGYACHFTVRAQADGRHVDEVGSCDTVTDRPGSPLHVVRTMAKTRATSRAIASLMGKSEQSAEDADMIPQNCDTIPDTPGHGAQAGGPADDTAGPKQPDPATAKQINFIKSLGYSGVIPFSKKGADLLIASLRSEKEESE